MARLPEPVEHAASIHDSVLKLEHFAQPRSYAILVLDKH